MINVIVTGCRRCGFVAHIVGHAPSPTYARFEHATRAAARLAGGTVTDWPTPRSFTERKN